MGFKNLCGLLALVSTLLSASSALAAPRLQLHPIDLLGYKGQALRLAVELPCGGSYVGIVAKDAGKGRLELAAAIRRDSIVCTSLPDPVELLVDYIDTTGYETIAAMKVREGAARLVVARIEELRRVPVKKPMKKKERKIEALFTSRCGQEAGTLLRRVAERSIEVAFVERTPEAGQACPAKPQRRLVAGLDPKAVYEVMPARERTTSLRRAYYLRFAEVKAGSVERLGTAGVRLSYKRACDEAPVGIVLAGQGRQVRVGMLVARYYNHPCDAATTEAGGEWTTAEEKGLALASGLQIVLQEATPRDESLRVRAPVEVSKVRRKSGEGVSVSYHRSCAPLLGTVYARDARGKLAVGVVAAPGAGAMECKLRPAEVSLFQPFIARHVQDHELFPLRLSGSPSA